MFAAACRMTWSAFQLTWPSLHRGLLIFNSMLTSSIDTDYPAGESSFPPGAVSSHLGIASNHYAPWTDIPSEFLHAELTRRYEALGKPLCGSGKARGSYNTSFHVAALVLILVLSTGGKSGPFPLSQDSPLTNSITACSFPIIVRRFPRFPIPHHFLFLSRHFGTGVLIATAFVHLLPTAFVSLTDPCLPSFWNHGYPAMAGLIAMVSVMLVVGIEMFFATRGAGHMHGSEYDVVPGDSDSHEHQQMGNGHAGTSRSRRNSMRPFRQTEIGSTVIDLPLAKMRRSVDNLVPGSPPASRMSTAAIQNARNSEDPDTDTDESPPPSASILLPSSHLPNPSSSLKPSELQTQQKLLLQCLLLEAGILFHSVFIGIALSVSLPPAFYVLLVAISFHQTFEGLALGSRIASATYTLPSTSPQPWLMALAYGTTTPIGQAIGLAVHGLYDPESEAGLLMVGIMNAVSSGLLLFAGLVELLAEDFLSDRSYEVLTGRRRFEACGAVIAGGALMALVGAWA